MPFDHEKSLFFQCLETLLPFFPMVGSNCVASQHFALHRSKSSLEVQRSGSAAAPSPASRAEATFPCKVEPDLRAGSERARPVRRSRRRRRKVSFHLKQIELNCSRKVRFKNVGQASLPAIVQTGMSAPHPYTGLIFQHPLCSRH